MRPRESQFPRFVRQVPPAKPELHDGARRRHCVPVTVKFGDVELAATVEQYVDHASVSRRVSEMH